MCTGYTSRISIRQIAVTAGGTDTAGGRYAEHSRAFCYRSCTGPGLCGAHHAGGAVVLVDTEHDSDTDALFDFTFWVSAFLFQRDENHGFDV